MHTFSRCLLSAIAVVALANVAQADERAAYQVVGEGAAQVRADFNAAKGSVRALFVVDPICPGCLRGLDDMNKDLLSKNDPRLQTFIVHVPRMTPPPKEKDVPEAATLRVPAHDGHDSEPMADTIPTAWRTAFRWNGGHFSGRIGTLSAMIS